MAAMSAWAARCRAGYRVGYELWRQLNDFPLEFGNVTTPKDGAKEEDTAKIAAKVGKPK